MIVLNLEVPVKKTGIDIPGDLDRGPLQPEVPKGRVESTNTRTNKNKRKMANQREEEEIMEYILLCSSIDGTKDDAHVIMKILRSFMSIKTPVRLYYYGKNLPKILLDKEKILRVQYQQLNHLFKWMDTYVTQDGKQRNFEDLRKSLQEWRQTITKDTFQEFMQTGKIRFPLPPTPQPKPITSKQSAPDPPGYHISESKARVPTLIEDHIPTTPARTMDPGESKPNTPGIQKKNIQEEVRTPIPATLAPIDLTKERYIPSPTTVMSHPTWEYWCHPSTPFRGVYPSYDDDYCNGISLPTMAAPTPISTSDICIIGDPPYQFRGGQTILEKPRSMIYV